MDKSNSRRAREVALAVSAFESKQTGRPPKSVAVALGGETLAVTLHGVLSPAEQAVARTVGGIALVQKYRRALFVSACGPLRREIGRIAGAEVREATAGVRGTTGTVVMVFQLAGSVPPDTWSGSAPGD